MRNLKMSTPPAVRWLGNLALLLLIGPLGMVACSDLPRVIVQSPPTYDAQTPTDTPGFELPPKNLCREYLDLLVSSGSYQENAVATSYRCHTATIDSTGQSPSKASGLTVRRNSTLRFQYSAAQPPRAVELRLYPGADFSASFLRWPHELPPHPEAPPIIHLDAGLDSLQLPVVGAGQYSLVVKATWGDEVEVYYAINTNVQDDLQELPEPLASSSRQTFTSLSPDGRWQATTVMFGPAVVGDDEQYHTRLQVARTDGSIDLLIFEETSHFGLGYTIPAVVHWSADGEYLFYTNRPVVDGCAIFVNGSDLHRFSLEDGTTETILAAGASWLSLSPDERLLAYLHRTGMELSLILRHLEGDPDELSAGLPPQYTQGGSMLWSPDGRALVMTVVASPCDPANQRFSIVHVDVTTMTMTHILTNQLRKLTSETWTEPGTIRLLDEEGLAWLLDISTGELAEVK